CAGCLITETGDVWAGEELQFGGTYPVGNGALRLEYGLSGGSGVFLEANGYYSPVHDERTREFVLGPSQNQESLRELEFVDGEVHPVDVAPQDALNPPDAVSAIGFRLGVRKHLGF